MAKNSPPNGRAKNPTAKVAKAASVPTAGSFLEELLSEHQSGPVPYMKKSYHSNADPTAEAITTCLIEVGAAGLSV